MNNAGKIRTGCGVNTCVMLGNSYRMRDEYECDAGKMRTLEGKRVILTYVKCEKMKNGVLERREKKKKKTNLEKS